ncbi:hypothetical protein [Hyperthermus butylicus]|uniref:Uncharacterized protein n=1 Tax=Hyperthermus butylicus (strain DSM 5456 / JCM 9403 / PLM1-5) TaxID=415426 RepID=A2BJQ0_HYPBU|nr:hypothetical protein [Hyperthermus butylicus]ABM80211.1 hypothetical protein Hbut_0339 [Hyperthermus butylicus DSM 5456]
MACLEYVWSWSVTYSEYLRSLEVLRVAVLARLALEPASLPRLLDDLYRLRETGYLPRGFRVADVVAELGFYRRAGLVYEGVDGRLYLDDLLLSPAVKELVYSEAVRIASLLGIRAEGFELQPAIAEAGVGVEASA